MTRPQFSRRNFTACLTAPLFVASSVLGKPGRPGANDRVRIGVIGVGNRAGLLIDQLPAGGQVIAAADCNLPRPKAAAAKRSANWEIYQDYRRLLDRKDIDAVIVATTDHGRVLPSIHACQAGKDVYAEKPLTAYVAEGRALVQAARRYKRVFQVGSQQRSMAMNRIACRFVREGGLGKLKVVHAFNYPGSTRYTPMPEQPVPEGLDWDVWLGPTPMRPYNKKLHGSWMSWWDYSGGEMTNWGAHGLDQVQWALGMDGSGPVELWPLGGAGSPVAFRYASGVTVQLDSDDKKLLGGARFEGEKGSIDIVRNGFQTDPPGMVTEVPSPAEVEIWSDKTALWQAGPHMQNWLDCIRTREKPLADVEIGHRSVSLCHLANITRESGRKLRWDAAKERFVGDEAANRTLRRERRKAYELPRIG